jgi:hypothetical protein
LKKKREKLNKKLIHKAKKIDGDNLHELKRGREMIVSVSLSFHTFKFMFNIILMKAHVYTL